jgi:hypothetical protein
MAKQRMDVIMDRQTMLKASLNQVAQDFDDVPKVREMLFETQPVELAMYTDHFTIDSCGAFIFHRALRSFEVKTTPRELKESFIGSINIEDIAGRCVKDNEYAKRHVEFCMFCQKPEYAHMCNPSAPYYYWINHNPESSDLWASFEHQCLDISNEKLLMNPSCELIDSAVPTARLSRVYHLFKMIVDSMTLAQLSVIFRDDEIDSKIDVTNQFSYIMVDKLPVQITYSASAGSTTYTLGNDKRMPFAQLLIILALKLKEENKSLPYLNVGASEILPGSMNESTI